MEFKDDGKFYLSGNEQLTRSALSKNPDGCFVVHRQFESKIITYKSKHDCVRKLKKLKIILTDIEIDNPKASNYIDTDSNNKHLTANADKQSKFNEFLRSQLKDHTQHQFSLPWDEKNIELFENWFTYSEEEFKEKCTSPTKTDAKILKYYQKFNSIVIYKLKNLIEKHIYEEKIENDNEASLYHEIERHLHRYQSLTEHAFFFSSDIYRRVSLLIEAGKHQDHFPLFIYGSAVSGKTLTLVNCAQAAIENIQPKNCEMIIKFSDLTSQVSSFENLMLALCEQLCVLNDRSIVPMQKNKSVPSLVSCFFKMCQEFSFTKPHKNLLILVDGLKDFNVDCTMIKKTNVTNNQVFWLFKEKLPPRVHLIVTIKRLYNKSKLHTSFNSLVSNNSSISSTDENTVSLFLNCFNDRSDSTTDAISMFELPYNKLELKTEICEFIKAELGKKNKFLSQNQVGLIFQNALNSSKHMATTSKADEGSEHFFLFINLMINQITDCSLFSNCSVDKENLPLECESIIKLKLRKCCFLFYRKLSSTSLKLNYFIKL